MIDDYAEGLPYLIREMETPPEPLAADPTAMHESPAPSAADQRLAEAAFAQAQRESEEIARVVGLWTGTLLLHDLMRDSLADAKEQREEEKKKLQPGEDPKT